MRLKSLRKAKKMRQIDMAEFLSCSQSVYSRYENDERTIPTDILMKIAEFFKVSTDYILGRENTIYNSNPKQLSEQPLEDEINTMVDAMDQADEITPAQETDLIKMYLINRLSGMSREALEKARSYLDFLAQEGK